MCRKTARKNGATRSTHLGRTAPLTETGITRDDDSEIEVASGIRGARELGNSAQVLIVSMLLPDEREQYTYRNFSTAFAIL
jgi:hypothetical protein